MIETNDPQESRRAPFKGHGVVSRWELSIPRETNDFDPVEISDVALHVTYRAREGTPELIDAARVRAAEYVAGAELDGGSPPQISSPNVGQTLFSASRDFALAWASFAATPSGTDAVLAVDLAPSLFSPRIASRSISIERTDVFFVGAGPAPRVVPSIRIVLPGMAEAVVEVAGSDGTFYAGFEPATAAAIDAGPFELYVPSAARAALSAADIWLVCTYRAV
jgi:hypothetical protein